MFWCHVGVSDDILGDDHESLSSGRPPVSPPLWEHPWVGFVRVGLRTEGGEPRLVTPLTASLSKDCAVLGYKSSCPPCPGTITGVLLQLGENHVVG